MLALCQFSLSLAGGARPVIQSPRGAVVNMQAVAEAAPAKPYDLTEPVFPEVCEYAGITLSRYVLEMARANPDKPELNELVSVMTSVERACKTISKLVRTAPIESAGLLGLEDGGNSINVQGEEQKKLDVSHSTHAAPPSLLAPQAAPRPLLAPHAVPPTPLHAHTACRSCVTTHRMHSSLSGHHEHGAQECAALLR